MYFCRSYVHVPKISTGAQIGLKSRKTGSHVFCIFTPLYRRFRPSGVLQTIDLEEIYRFVSKILNFMPSGSVLSHFYAFFNRFSPAALHGKPRSDVAQRSKPAKRILPLIVAKASPKDDQREKG